MSTVDPKQDLTSDWPRRLFRARIAVYIAFLLAGVGTGIWAAHIPLVQARLGLNPAILGLALFVMAFGALLTMPLAGVALARLGSRLPAAAMMIAFTALTPLPILAGSVPVFFFSCLPVRTTIGALDVSMNLQATEVEAARGRPTMSSFHGFFSIGGLAGAGLGAGIIALGWGDGSGAAAAGGSACWRWRSLHPSTCGRARARSRPARASRCPTARLRPWVFSPSCASPSKAR